VGFVALAAVVWLVTVGAIAQVADTPLVYVALVAPVVLGLAWWRPVWGLVGLLGLVLVSDQYGQILAGEIEPFLLQALPLFENMEEYTPFSFAYTNLVELWLVLLTAIWFLRGLQQGTLRLRPVACQAAWVLAAATIGLTFVLGLQQGGDVKAALWEVRALGYLLGLGWLVPQILERPRDVRIVLWTVVLALGAKALQGLYRYFVVLRMQLALEDTFLAHEDPIMFIPLFFLLVTLRHYRVAPRLTRALMVAAPVMLVALVLTQRRVAYVALPLCGLAFLVQLSPDARRAFARLAAPAAVLGLVYVAVFFGSSSPLARPIDRALQLVDDTNTSNQYRLLETANLRYTVLAHPWGLGFGHPFEIRHDLPKVWVFWDVIPHNQILWIWAKSGTLGFILVMFYFARVLAESTWAARRLADPLFRAIAPVIGVTIVSQLIASYYELQLIYGRNMVYVGTLVGLLGPIVTWGGARAAWPAGRRSPAAGARAPAVRLPGPVGAEGRQPGRAASRTSQTRLGPSRPSERTRTPG
jgi:hypothetical protein